MGGGEPLLLLHGNTASAAMFADVVEHYADRFTVYLIDFLGHGKSDRVERLATDLWYNEALQVITFLEHMGLKKFDASFQARRTSCNAFQRRSIC